MRNTSPLVTIGMPSFNNAMDIRRSIKSLQNQTYTNWELIIIDDGSTDETSNVVKQITDPRIKLICESTNKGLAFRLNQAVSLAQGKYFARMDADDISFPERLERQVDHLERNVDIDLVGTGLLVFKGEGVPFGRHPIKETHEIICARPWGGFHLAHATWMGKIEWFKKNQYRSDLRRAEDQELLLRSYKTSRFYCIPSILYGYRINDLSLKKTVRERYILTRAVVDFGLATRNYTLVLSSLLGNLAKALVDIIAIGSGLKYKILRHRAMPIELGILDKWQSVWQQSGEV